jgi:hypothetical protein
MSRDPVAELPHYYLATDYCGENPRMEKSEEFGEYIELEDARHVLAEESARIRRELEALLPQKWDGYEVIGVAEFGTALVRICPERGTLPSPSCTWTEDSDGAWKTSCGEVFLLSAGTPAENGMRFCPYCGKGLEPAPLLYSAYEDDDEPEPTAEEEPACIEPSDEIDALIDDALSGEPGDVSDLQEHEDFEGEGR